MKKFLDDILKHQADDGQPQGATPSEPQGATPSEPQGEATHAPATDAKTYTEAEFNKMQASYQKQTAELEKTVKSIQTQLEEANMTAEQKAQAEIERARQELEEKAVQAETKATSYFASAEIAKRGLNGFVDVDDFIGRGYSEADIVAKLDARKKAVDDQLAQRIADQNKQAANEFRTAGNGNTQPTKHTIVSKY